MSMQSQLLKGILEGCMLSIMSNQSVYGYELSMKLRNYGLSVSEGSIYPVLVRLQREKLIRGEMKKSPNGPNRKYYFLTEKGAEVLEEFRTNWEGIKISVDRMLRKE